MGAIQTPPGWYVDPSNTAIVRWWDGGQWTHHTQPLAPPPPTAPPSPVYEPPPPAVPPPPIHQPSIYERTGLEPTALQQGYQPDQYADHHQIDHRPWWQRKRVVISSGVVALGLVVATIAGSPGSTDDATGEVEAGVEGSEADLNPLVDASGAEDDSAAGAMSTSSTKAHSSTTTLSSTTATTEATSTTAGAGNALAEASSGDGAEARSRTPATTARPTTAVPTSATTTAPPTTAAPTASTAPPSTALPSTAPTTAAPTTTATPPTTTGGCHPAYNNCLPYHPGDALNCGDLSPAQKPVTVYNPSVDPYGLDGDNDGIGCESG